MYAQRKSQNSRKLNFEIFSILKITIEKWKGVLASDSTQLTENKYEEYGNILFLKFCHFRIDNAKVGIQIDAA